MNEAILLVDDDEDTRMLLCEGLRRRGYNVDAVDSAQACLERLDTAAVAVVVTDVEMPGMSGIELCDALRKRHPNLISIVVTGLKDLRTTAAALASGAFEFLAKPVKLAALDIAIRRAFEQHNRG